MSNTSLLTYVLIVFFCALHSFSSAYRVTSDKTIGTMKKMHVNFLPQTQKRSYLFATDENKPSPESSPESIEKPKGFGKPVPKKEAEAKDIGTVTYEKQAKRGIPEYNIFIRPMGGDVTEWVPVGSMTIPRDTPVSKAVYEVEKELIAGTFKLYPKLKAYYDVKKDTAQENGVFEYGYILKAFPDEEIKIIKKSDLESSDGNFFSNWLGKITNPIDTSTLKNKGSIKIENK